MTLHAAHDALTHSPPTPNSKEPLKDFSRRTFLSKETLSNIRIQIREIAWKCAGVVRSEEGMKEGLTKVTALEKELKGIIPQTISSRKLKYDLTSAAFVLKAILTASLSREESRGAFIREDFPQQDDLKWQRNSCLVYDIMEESFSLRYGMG